MDLMSALLLHDRIRSLQPSPNLSPNRCQQVICKLLLAQTSRLMLPATWINFDIAGLQFIVHRQAEDTAAMLHLICDVCRKIKAERNLKSLFYTFLFFTRNSV